MAQGMRPGGLTALAVVNFVFCGVGILMVFGTAISVKKAPIALEELEREAEERAERGEEERSGAAAQRAQFRLILENESSIYMQALITLVEAIFLLLSGLGYMKLKRVMGRYLGTITAFIGIGSVAHQLTFLPFELMHMVSLIYPLMTLVLLNTTFREDLVH